MRLAVLTVLFGELACAPPKVHSPPGAAPPTPPFAQSSNAVPASPPADDSPAPVTFESDVRPILEARCTPCHFEGGKMYAKLPFDDPATIRRLGTDLFTRLREEQDQATVRAFLSSP